MRYVVQLVAIATGSRKYQKTTLASNPKRDYPQIWWSRDWLHDQMFIHHIKRGPCWLSKNTCLCPVPKLSPDWPESPFKHQLKQFGNENYIWQSVKLEVHLKNWSLYNIPMMYLHLIGFAYTIEILLMMCLTFDFEPSFLAVFQFSHKSDGPGLLNRQWACNILYVRKSDSWFQWSVAIE
jgi:hypothetical protein